jgi:hypothetical protein
MLTVAQLGLPVEPTASTVGVTLLPTHTVEALMLDRRRHELLHPFKLTLLKFTSQVRAAPAAQRQHARAPCPCHPASICLMTASACVLSAVGAIRAPGSAVDAQQVHSTGLGASLIQEQGSCLGPP